MHEFHADGSHAQRLMSVRGVVHHDLVDFPEAYGDVRAWGPGMLSRSWANEEEERAFPLG